MGKITLVFAYKLTKQINWKQKLFHGYCFSFIILYNWDSRPDSAEILTVYLTVTSAVIKVSTRERKLRTAQN